LKPILRVAAVVSCACAVVIALSGVSFAQNIDLAVGGSSLWGTKASQATSGHSPESLSGGSYFSVSGDWLLHKRFGVQAEVAWRGSRAIYFPGGFNQPYRPFFYDANAIWAPKIRKRLAAEFLAGVGIENTRFYKGNQACTFLACTNFVTSTHFMEHLGGGLRVYAFHGLFVRPEAHLYLIHNNVEFSSNHTVRYGVSMGYSF
jgi:hypothetical protein